MIKRLRYKKWKKIIEKSGLFDVKYYLFTYPDVRLKDINPIMHYIKYGANEGRNPSKEFHTSFYLEMYPDVKKSKMNPLVHYILYGKKENRKTNSSAILHHENSSNQNNELLQKAYELLQKNNGSKEEFDIKYKKSFLNYLENHKGKSIDIPNLFSSELYKELYPDMHNKQINTLVHYLKHGQKEGRIGYLDLDRYTKKGNLEFDATKETVVFVSHESSASGAPLLGFGIADALVKKYNIVHIVIKEANIHEIFFSNCDLMFSSIEKNPYIYSYLFLKHLLKERPIKCVMINSIVGYQIMYAAYKLDIPIIFLIHEFAEYMRPFGTMIDAVLHSEIIITPATIIQNSIQKEFKRFANYKELPSNMHILPQGKLPYIPDTYGDDDTVDDLYKKLKIDKNEDVKIIVGSGWVQIRKGVDLFVAVARYIKELYNGKCKFVWVGEGFDPDKDLAYSVYLDREIEYSGLGDDFVFLEHQKNLDNIFSIADVFCLSSRMDPFPNVAIDALSHDLHIACFDDASGTAEFLRKHNANCTIVNFVDTYKLAEGITHYLKTDEKKIGLNRKIVENHLNFDKYVEHLDEFIEKAQSFKKRSSIIQKKILKANAFDSDFFGGKGLPEEKCRKYVEYGLKGIHFYNPKKGFSEIGWIEKHSRNNQSIVPLYEAIVSNKVKTHHDVVSLPIGKKEKITFKYAVHLHLYYIDMASYFVTYFQNLPSGYDLYITIVKEDFKESIEKQFENCGASNVKVVFVENIGRDMGPLLFELKNEILDKKYEVIGHFHSKKSLDLEAGGGDRWLEYLMKHLIGDKENAQDVLSIFNNKLVGLVFPEDTNTSDIGENKEFVTHLCEMLKLPFIEQTPIFPMGNMFWARLDAIKELFELNSSLILQPEPLPYDGSYMHAIERISPFLVQKNKYKYVTIYKKGFAWK